MTAESATTDIIPLTDHSSTTHTPNELPDTYATVIVWIIALIMLFSLIGNALALSSLSRNRKSVYPWFFNLAFSDLLKTLFCMPYSIYLTQSDYFSNSDGFENDTKCQIFGYIFHLTMLMGLISNMCVALDRVHATYFPFHYSNNLKRCPAQYLILITWLFVPLIAALPFFLQTGPNAKSPFSLPDLYMPMCVFDIWDANALVGEKREKLDIYVVLYYSILYMLPILVIVTCTCLVMKKLLPRIMAERKLHECTKSSVIIANSTAMGDKDLTTVGDENQLANLSPSGANCSSPKSGRKSRFSVLDNMLKLHTGTKQVNRTHSKRNQDDDSGTMLYWRAIQTMIIVSIAFVMCHVMHIMYWVLYNDVFKEIDSLSDVKLMSKTSFIALSCVKTGQIIIVYFDAAVNVMVYYSRCTLIKESMLDTARTFMTVLMSPVFLIMRNIRD